MASKCTVFWGQVYTFKRMKPMKKVFHIYLMLLFYKMF